METCLTGVAPPTKVGRMFVRYIPALFRFAFSMVCPKKTVEPMLKKSHHPMIEKGATC